MYICHSVFVLTHTMFVCIISNTLAINQQHISNTLGTQYTHDACLYYYYVQVLREGWLLKQSKTLKMWQKRYFVLDSVALYWYPITHFTSYFTTYLAETLLCPWLTLQHTLSLTHLTTYFTAYFRAKSPHDVLKSTTLDSTSYWLHNLLFIFYFYFFIF